MIRTATYYKHLDVSHYIIIIIIIVVTVIIVIVILIIVIAIDSWSLLIFPF